MVTASQNYLPFGVGRRMWLAYLIYIGFFFDIKLREGEPLTESWFVTENLANGSAAVLFRKRKKTDG